MVANCRRCCNVGSVASGQERRRGIKEDTVEPLEGELRQKKGDGDVWVVGVSEAPIRL